MSSFPISFSIINYILCSEIAFIFIFFLHSTLQDQFNILLSSNNIYMTSLCYFIIVASIYKQNNSLNLPFLTHHVNHYYYLLSHRPFTFNNKHKPICLPFNSSRLTARHIVFISSSRSSFFW